MDEPGLVLALDPLDGAECTGLALRVRDGEEASTVTYLRERELISSAYVEQLVPLTLHNGMAVHALAFVVDAAHDQYVAHLSLHEQAEIIARAVGGRGPNTEYLWNTVSHLDELGIVDPDLSWLSDRVRQLAASGS